MKGSRLPVKVTVSMPQGWSGTWTPLATTAMSRCSPGADVLERQLARRIPHVDDAARNGRYRMAGGIQVRIQIEVMVSGQRRQGGGRNDRYARYRQPHGYDRSHDVGAGHGPRDREGGVCDHGRLRLSLTTLTCVTARSDEGARNQECERVLHGSERACSSWKLSGTTKWPSARAGIK